LLTDKQTDKQTNDGDYIISLAEVYIEETERNVALGLTLVFIKYQSLLHFSLHCNANRTCRTG